MKLRLFYARTLVISMKQRGRWCGVGQQEMFLTFYSHDWHQHVGQTRAEDQHRSAFFSLHWEDYWWKLCCTRHKSSCFILLSFGCHCCSHATLFRKSNLSSTKNSFVFCLFFCYTCKCHINNIMNKYKKYTVSKKQKQFLNDDWIYWR